MPNVIKQRQLVDGQKLTPKSDFVFSSAKTSAETLQNSIIFNSDLTYKQNGQYTYDTNAGYIKSVGKGEVAWIDVNGTQVRFVINPKDKYTQVRYLVIDTYNSTNKYYEHSDIFTFLGQCYEGDEDRYVALCYYDETTPNYLPIIYNIDKMEIKHKIGSAGSSQIFKQFTFDGVDKIYYQKKANPWIETGTLEGLGVGRLSEDSRELYGLNDTQAFLRNDANELISHTIATGETSVIGTIGEDTSVVMFPNGSFRSLIRGFANSIQLKGNGTTIDITESINSLVTYTPTVHRPQVLLNYFEDDTKVEFTIVYSLKVSQTHIICVKTTITKVDNSVVSELIGDRSLGAEVGIIEQLLLNRSFSNSCNTYGPGKFYNYGLQKKWDDYHA